MKKLYLAKRIQKNPDPRFILSVNTNMSLENVIEAYVEKIYVTKRYIYNGPWVLRAPFYENVFAENNMPPDLKPINVWEMVKQKIDSSDIFIGIISGKSYGTIAEVGYACNSTKIAVYVLPEINLSYDELQDLWFVFQMAFNTENLWLDEDIKNIEEFNHLNIFSINDYKSYVSKIIPNFMKK